MIKKLILENFILIEKLELEFKDGLNVITGETGAGKSILIGSIDLVLGNQIRTEIAYDTDKPVYIQADFALNQENKELMELVEFHGFDISENELFFAKKVTTSGKTTSYINGVRVTNAIVQQFRSILVDFHNQNDQQLLLRPDYQLNVLDSYGKLLNEREEYNRTLASLKQLQEEIYELRREDKENKEKIALYLFQINEIESTRLQSGEDKDIEQELELLTHAEEILGNSSELVNELYDNDNSIYDKLSRYTREFNKYAKDNSLIEEIDNLLNETLVSMDDLVSSARSIPQKIQNDPQRLTDLESRLNSINELKSKYHSNTIEGIIEYYKRISTEVTTQKANKSSIEKLENRLIKLREKLVNIGSDLSKKRENISKKLSVELQKQIRKLSMPDSVFQILIDKKPVFESNNQSEGIEYPKNGFDSVRYMFSSNKGVEPKLLKEAISGGELSRVMLAVKRVLSSYLQSRLIVFDEIDAGIGGKTADIIADIISEMNSQHQIMCITHLPQIASVGKNHLLIAKDSSGKKTKTEIYTLSGEARINEIARMLSGSNSSIALQHAAELLKRKEWS
ncbi:MAG: DNA repair protein RecN [Candidatus Zophobacter franzmannii]|nr:DNA repair protein RecN [Candidatus Zophobacter franzmannii]